MILFPAVMTTWRSRRSIWGICYLSSKLLLWSCIRSWYL